MRQRSSYKVEPTEYVFRLVRSDLFQTLFYAEVSLKLVLYFTADSKKESKSLTTSRNSSSCLRSRS